MKAPYEFLVNRGLSEVRKLLDRAGQNQAISPNDLHIKNAS